jgi:hypothetical protein
MGSKSVSELIRRRQLLAEANAAYAALREDAPAWEAFEAERAEWDVTLEDGLPEEQYLHDRLA